MVKADLDYPPSLHVAHNDLPLATERLYIKDEWLSDKQRSIKAQFDFSRGSMSSKLVPNLMNKRDYVLDYRNLKYYIEHGLKLVKVHAAIKYKQSKWMAPYIEVNQNKRKEAKTDFSKEFFKLMNNSVFGKTCENQKKRTNIKLVNDPIKLMKLVAKPELMNVEIFDENLAAVELQKIKLNIAKPFYVGFVILELAKLHIYRFLFKFIEISFRSSPFLPIIIKI